MDVYVWEKTERKKKQQQSKSIEPKWIESAYKSRKLFSKRMRRNIQSDVALCSLWTGDLFSFYRHLSPVTYATVLICGIQFSFGRYVLSVSFVGYFPIQTKWKCVVCWLKWWPDVLDYKWMILQSINNKSSCERSQIWWVRIYHLDQHF